MIDYIDPINRLVYLDASTVDETIQPIDIYRDMRLMRKVDEELRKYPLFLTMKGAEKKNPDGSKRTERYMVLLDNTFIVPYNTSHTLTVDGTIITDSGLEGVEVFNRSVLSAGIDVDINYVPKQVEIITITTGGSSLTTDEHDQLMALSPGSTAQEIWEYASRVLTSTSQGGGATAQEVWEYATRELTSAVSGGLDEVQLHAFLDTYANKDNWKADLVSVINRIDAVKQDSDTKLDTIILNTDNIANKVWSYII